MGSGGAAGGRRGARGRVGCEKLVALLRCREGTETAGLCERRRPRISAMLTDGTAAPVGDEEIDSVAPRAPPAAEPPAAAGPSPLGLRAVRLFGEAGPGGPGGPGAPAAGEAALDFKLAAAVLRSGGGGGGSGSDEDEVSEVSDPAGGPGPPFPSPPPLPDRPGRRPGPAPACPPARPPCPSPRRARRRQPGARRLPDRARGSRAAPRPPPPPPARARASPPPWA